MNAMEVIDSHTLCEEGDSELLMLLATLNPQDGFAGATLSDDGTPIIHDLKGNSGESHPSDYHLESNNC